MKAIKNKTHRPLVVRDATSTATSRTTRRKPRARSMSRLAAPTHAAHRRRS
jgi:hypothetical protein